MSNILISLIQLAAVYCVSRISGYCACCYARNLAVLIEGNLAVNYGIAILHVNRCALTVNHTCNSCCTIQCQFSITIGNSVAGYVDISQFCTLISIYAIFGCNSASGFDSTVGTADAYIFAGQVAKHDILVQVNLVNFLTVKIGFFNVDVTAVYNLAVFACFGCYCMQLAAVYSISGISGYCACCYARNLAVLINGYLIVNLNIAAIQNDGGSAVGNLVAGYVDICQFCTLISIYAIFSCNVAGGFDSTVSTADVYIFAGQVAKHDILVQVNLVNLLTVNISFFNIDVGAIYNLAVFACFGCYCMQLADVYCIGICFAFCYIDNLTISVFAAYGYCISSVSYTAGTQSNSAFRRYRSTVADSNCIIRCNCIFITEGNNIASVTDCVIIAHYKGVGNIGQCIVRACHEYVLAAFFLITGKFVSIADNGRIGLFGNSVGTADYCYSTAFLFSKNRIVTSKNS